MMVAFGAPIQIRREAPDILIVEQRRMIAIARLLLVLAFAAVFYYVLLQLGEIPERVPLLEHVRARLSITWLNGLLLFLPLVVLPELVANLRVFACGNSLRFDSTTQVIQQNHRVVASFADVREVQLLAVNGTCEEWSLSALLNDGRKLDIDTSGSLGKTLTLAEELCDLLGVALVRHKSA